MFSAIQSVRTRLWLLVAIFMVAIAVLVAQGLVALRALETAANRMGDGKDIVADILPPPLYLIETQLVAHEILGLPVADRPALAQRFTQLKKDYQDRNDYWKTRSADVAPEVLASLFGPQKENADAYWNLLEKTYLPAALGGKDEEAAQVLTELKKRYIEHRAGVDATVKLAGDWSGSRLAQLADTTRQAILVLCIVAALSLLAGGLVSRQTLRAVVTPLSALEHAIQRTAADSDFSQTIAVTSNDELGQTTERFNHLVATLRSALSDIQRDVGSISSEATQLSSLSRQLASSSDQESAAAASMAATVEEVTVSIGHVSDNAAQAAEASRLSGELASHGGRVIREAAGEITQIADTVHSIAAAIENLDKQSQQISSVVRVIKEVAEQTNLLALNAAIEAARAGEQGRGFAVVADEVRKLAERTTVATEEIAQVIQAVQDTSRSAIDSVSSAVQRVGGGVSLANDAGLAIQKIENETQRVLELVGEISASLIQQRAASTDIAQQVEKVARMAEENSSSSGENASAANKLAALADHLQRVTAKFRIS